MLVGRRMWFCLGTWGAGGELVLFPFRLCSQLALQPQTAGWGGQDPHAGRCGGHQAGLGSAARCRSCSFRRAGGGKDVTGVKTRAMEKGRGARCRTSSQAFEGAAWSPQRPARPLPGSLEGLRVAVQGLGQGRHGAHHAAQLPSLDLAAEALQEAVGVPAHLLDPQVPPQGAPFL